MGVARRPTTDPGHESDRRRRGRCGLVACHCRRRDPQDRSHVGSLQEDPVRLEPFRRAESRRRSESLGELGDQIDFRPPAGHGEVADEVLIEARRVVIGAGVEGFPRELHEGLAPPRVGPHQLIHEGVLVAVREQAVRVGVPPVANRLEVGRPARRRGNSSISGVRRMNSWPDDIQVQPPRGLTGLRQKTRSRSPTSSRNRRRSISKSVKNASSSSQNSHSVRGRWRRITCSLCRKIRSTGDGPGIEHVRDTDEVRVQPMVHRRSGPDP